MSASSWCLLSNLWGGELEELDDVAGGVLEEDLLAARSREEVVAERSTGAPKSRDLGIDVVDDQVDAIPAARSRLGAIRHGPSRRARRSAEQQPQVAAGDVGECGREVRQHFEVEELRVEGDGLLDVVDHVANADHVLGVTHDFSFFGSANAITKRWLPPISVTVPPWFTRMSFSCVSTSLCVWNRARVDSS